MNAFRQKLLDWKKRLSDKKMYSIVIVTIAIIGGWGIYEFKRAGNLRQQLDNTYNRSFYNLVGHVADVQALLTKAIITGTSLKTASILQDIWREADFAQTELSQIPISQHVLANTSKFLVQLSNYSYALASQTQQGNVISDSQYASLKQLKDMSQQLTKSLITFREDIFAKKIKWGEMRKQGNYFFKKTSEDLAKSNLDAMNKIFKEYPTLIYDGPFSDHLTNIEPKGVTGDNINSSSGEDIVKKLIGANKIKSITNAGEKKNAPIKTFNYNVSLNGIKDKDTVNVEITQKGGHILRMLNHRQVGKANIDIGAAKKIGETFLGNNGYANMTDTYYLIEGNIVTINYAYRQENVVIYPDLIKVKVALDNGEVMGVESKGYLYSHTTRTIPTPKITLENARTNISKKVNITGSDLAIIPTKYNKEVFVYEFKGTVDNQDFLVYINAENGNEEDVLIIINTPNGTLTM